MDKREYAAYLNDYFQKAGKEELETFSYLANRLLGESCLLSNKKQDRSAYADASGTFLKPLEAYFALMDIHLRQASDDIVYLDSERKALNHRLDRDTFLVLVLLKKLDRTSLKEVSGTSAHVITLQTLLDAIETAKVFPNAVSVSFLFPILRLLREYKCIDFVGNSSSDLSNDLVIQIYPTVSLIINTDDLAEIETLLMSFAKKKEEETEKESEEENDEETDAD